MVSARYSRVAVAHLVHGREQVDAEMKAFLGACLVGFGLCSGATAQDEGGAPVLDLESMTLKVSGSMQFRYTINNREDVAAPDDDFSSGFSFRRLRPKVSGQTADKKLYFEVEGDLAGGDSNLVDAFIDYRPDERWRIRTGQFTLSFVRENILSSTKQLAMDRSSISANVFPVRGDRVQGVEARYQGDRYRAFATFHGGIRSFNQQYNSPNVGSGLAFRYEHLLAGESLKQFDQISAPHGTPFGLLLGGAVNYEQSQSGGDHFAWTADVSLQHNGFSFMVAGTGSIAEDLSLTGRAEHVWGVMAQAGLYVSERVEPYVRYEWGTTSNANESDFSLLVAGFNWYIYGHALKFSADAGYAFDSVTSTWDRSSNGLLVDATGEDGQMVFRSQIQLLF